MNDLILILTTMPDDDRAAAMARTLVDERLAACVNVHHSPPQATAVPMTVTVAHTRSLSGVQPPTRLVRIRRPARPAARRHLEAPVGRATSLVVTVHDLRRPRSARRAAADGRRLLRAVIT